MDLRAYYRRIREVERSLDDEYPVVKSLATEDGGKDGRLVEVSRAVAARMITDGIAKKASAKESQTLRVRVAEAREKEEKRRRAELVQFTVISEADLRALQQPDRSDRKG